MKENNLQCRNNKKFSASAEEGNSKARQGRRGELSTNSFKHTHIHKNMYESVCMNNKDGRQQQAVSRAS
jgi:hypothetical protein